MLCGIKQSAAARTGMSGNVCFVMLPRDVKFCFNARGGRLPSGMLPSCSSKCLFVGSIGSFGSHSPLEVRARSKFLEPLPYRPVTNHIWLKRMPTGPLPSLIFPKKTDEFWEIGGAN